MAKKIVIFISGMVLLSVAWMSMISFVQTNQEMAQKESLPVKFNLMQSRWERLANFTALDGKKLNSPAEFSLTFDVDLNLVKSTLSGGLDQDFYLDVKRAYLDAGRKVLFYTLNLEDKGRYLVRTLKINGGLEIVGFELDASLNYLRQGLGKNEWYLVDAKKRVMASDEKAYVGESYAVGENFETFNFDVLGQSYTFAVMKPKGANLAFANFMGVFGIFFVLCALYVYTEKEDESVGSVASNKFKTQSPEPPATLFGEQARPAFVERPKVFEEGPPEEVRMVDLTNTKKPEAKLDYTDFLMENPVLGGIETEAAVNVKIESAETQPPQEKLVENVSSNDWVKLAEELSENIDKFTQNLEKKKDSESFKTEV